MDKITDFHAAALYFIKYTKVFGEYFRAAGAEFTGISYFNGLVNTSSIWYYIKKV